MIADAEDLLLAGKMLVSDVAILYPRSSWIWDNATSQTHKGGPGILPPACVATVELYCAWAGGRLDMCSTCIDAWPSKIAEAGCPARPAVLEYCTGISASGPHGGEDQGSSDMDYMTAVYALFRQLQQVSNIAVEFVDEDDLTAAGSSNSSLFLKRVILSFLMALSLTNTQTDGLGLVETGLAQVKLLILTEPDIPTEGQTAIVKWMKGGGHVMTTTGAGA